MDDLDTPRQRSRMVHSLRNAPYGAKLRIVRALTATLVFVARTILISSTIYFLASCSRSLDSDNGSETNPEIQVVVYANKSLKDFEKSTLASASSSKHQKVAWSTEMEEMQTPIWSTISKATLKIKKFNQSPADYVSAWQDTERRSLAFPPLGARTLILNGSDLDVEIWDRDHWGAFQKTERRVDFASSERLQWLEASLRERNVRLLFNTRQADDNTRPIRVAIKFPCRVERLSKYCTSLLNRNRFSRLNPYNDYLSMQSRFGIAATLSKLTVPSRSNSPLFTRSLGYELYYWPTLPESDAVCILFGTEEEQAVLQMLHFCLLRAAHPTTLITEHEFPWKWLNTTRATRFTR
jgi:hypothetical protein